MRALVMNRRVCRIVLIALTLANAAIAADGPKEDDAALLHSLEQRQAHDSRLIQDALRMALDNNSEFTALKQQLSTLKSEVDHLRGGNQAKNEQLRAQWLAGSVAELRAEVAELASGVNRTEELAAREALAEELRMVRGDVAALRRDLDVLKGQTEGKMANLGERIKDLANQCGHQKKEEDNSILPGSVVLQDKKHYRHQRILRKRVDTLSLSQVRMEKQIQRLEERLQGPSHYQRVTTNDILEEDLTKRVHTLEDNSRQTSKSLFNITRQVAGLSKLHVSMLELLETVEGLESKVDGVVPEFRKEISRLEFSLAQVTSTVSIVREDQENQRTSVKAMGEAMSAMQEKLDQDHSRVKTLWTNLTTANHSKGEERPLTEPQHSTQLPGVVSRLTRLMDEYDSLVADLPNECSWVGGPSGLYVLAPGPGRPLVTFCDQSTGAGGWTVVQRRTDGSQEFNKNWQEYAVGFGTPMGEFYIGNHALHRLTAANLSSLRIDLVDIYGKAWYAEYDSFSVGNASDGFRLTVSGYHGNASDALDYQNHMQFSAKDSDRDVSNTHCAGNYEGGWWFSHCQHANLNGRYNLGLTWFDSSRNEWIAVARSEMKVRSRQRHRTAASA